MPKVLDTAEKAWKEAARSTALSERWWKKASEAAKKAEALEARERRRRRKLKLAA